MFWFKNHEVLFDVQQALTFSSTGNASNDLLFSKPKPWSSLMSGFFHTSSSIYHGSVANLSLMCHCVTPRTKSFESFIFDGVTDVEDWDALYQSFNDVVDASAQRRVDTKDDFEDEMYACMNLLALKGSFYKVAAEGVRIIVDEYVLPNEFKSIRRIKLPSEQRNDDDEVEEVDWIEDNENNLSEVQEVYEYAGVLFRIASCPATEVDHDSSSSRLMTAFSLDEVLRKRAANDERNRNAVQSAIESSIMEDIAVERWKMSQQNTNDGNSVRSVNTVIQRFHTLLSTTVDYCGFRVSVMCPTNAVDEPTTLVNGYCESRQVFVDADPVARQLFHKIAVKLHLRVSPISLPVCHDYLIDIDDEVDPATGTNKEHVIEEVLMFSREVQVHNLVMKDLMASDEQNTAKSQNDENDNDAPLLQRLYLLNCSSLAPFDLPKRDSFDLMTKQLRLEFSWYKIIFPS